MASIEAQFKQALCDAARRIGITIQPTSISETFALNNPARGTAVKCYRIEVAKPTELPALARLGIFKQSFHGVYVPGNPHRIDVDCVLSGPQMQNQPVDWFGAPTGALG